MNNRLVKDTKADKVFMIFNYLYPELFTSNKICLKARCFV